ncbi:MAG: hypothetical protein EOP33_04290 [Rickettsiaceae bacterium]|nr:MAG: hypothetical protein EOP33_04290 [Rickettsiaceae bacterium]
MAKDSSNSSQATQDSPYSKILSKIERILQLEESRQQVIPEERNKSTVELYNLYSEDEDSLDYRAQLENATRQMEITITREGGQVSQNDYNKVASELQRIYARDQKNGIEPGREPEKYERLIEVPGIISRYEGVISQVNQILQLEQEIRKTEDKIKKVEPVQYMHAGMPDGPLEYAKPDHEEQHKELKEELKQQQNSLQGYRGKLTQDELQQNISAILTPVMIRNFRSDQESYNKVVDQVQERGRLPTYYSYSLTQQLTKETDQYTKQQYVNSLKTKFQAILKSANPEAQDINWKNAKYEKLVKGFESMHSMNVTYPEQTGHTRTFDTPGTKQAVRQISIAAMATLDIMKEHSVDVDQVYPNVCELLTKSIKSHDIKTIVSNETADITGIEKIQNSLRETVDGLKALKDDKKLMNNMGPYAQEFIREINSISEIPNRTHSIQDIDRSIRGEFGAGVAGDVKLNNQNLEFRLIKLDEWCAKKLEETNKSIFSKVGQVVSSAASLVSHYVTSGLKSSPEIWIKTERLEKRFKNSLQACVGSKEKAADLEKIKEDIKIWAKKLRENQEMVSDPQNNIKLNQSKKEISKGGRG